MLYSKFHSLARSNSFDFGLVEEDPIVHLPIITTFAFELEVVESGLEILRMEFNEGSNKLKTASSKMYLDKYAYDLVRDLIDKKTVKYMRGDLVIDIKIAL